LRFKEKQKTPAAVVITVDENEFICAQVPAERAYNGDNEKAKRRQDENRRGLTTRLARQKLAAQERTKVGDARISKTLQKGKEPRKTNGGKGEEGW